MNRISYFTQVGNHKENDYLRMRIRLFENVEFLVVICFPETNTVNPSANRKPSKLIKMSAKITITEKT